MLRLIHEQVGLGAVLIDDIDDGLPNKTAHRIGSSGDPQVQVQDGYANEPKQSVYIPRVKAGEETIAGYIDLDETQRVRHSAFNGKIAGHQRAGNIRVVSFDASDLDAPDISGVTLGAPAAGDATIAGTGFLSTDPDITTVNFAGAGVGDVTLTVAQIEAVAPGAVSDTSIIVDSTLIAGLTSGDVVTVRADGQEDSFTLP